MSTSLKRQLAALAAPSSSLLVPDRRRSSILFSPKDAAKYDKDTFYQIGHDGLNELVFINRGLFEPFKDSVLFGESSIKYERIMEDEETNGKLDQVINEFLLALHPYVMLKASLKCLEWLVYRFHIERFNVDAILQCVLPYYDTKAFVMILQVLEIGKYQLNQEWEWLVPCKQSGAPLRKSVLFDNPNSKFILWMFFTFEGICRVHNRHPENLRVFLGFMVSTTVGILSKMKNDWMSKPNRVQSQKIIGLNILNRLYELLKALRDKEEYSLLKNNEEIFAMAYIVMVMLACCSREVPEMAEIVGSGLKQIFKLIIVNRGTIQQTETFLLLNLMIDLLNRQWEFNNAKTFTNALKDVAAVSEQWDLANVATKFILSNLRKGTLLSPGKVFNWVNDIELDLESRSNILRLGYATYKQDKTRKKQAKMFLSTFERQFPMEFEIACAKDSTLSSDLSKVKLGKDFRILVGHTNAVIRANAVKKLILNATMNGSEMTRKRGNLHKPMKPLVPDRNKIATALAPRFVDDSSEVLIALWKTKLDKLLKIFTPDTLVTCAMATLKKNVSLKCNKLALLKLCEIGERMPPEEILNKVIVLLIPYLFPRTEKQLKLSLTILKSRFASKQPVLQKYSSVLKKEELSFDDLCKESFGHMSSSSAVFRTAFVDAIQTPMQLTLACVLLPKDQILSKLLPAASKVSFTRCTSFPVKDVQFRKCIKLAEMKHSASFELLLTSLSKAPSKNFHEVLEVLKLVWQHAEKTENREAGMRFLQVYLPACFSSTNERYSFWVEVLRNVTDADNEFHHIRALQFVGAFIQTLANLVGLPSDSGSKRMTNTRKSSRNTKIEQTLENVNAWALVETVLTASLRHESVRIRSAGLDCLKVIVSRMTDKDPVGKFVSGVLQYEAEIRTDPEQLRSALGFVFAESQSGVKEAFITSLKSNEVADSRKIGILSICACIEAEVFHEVYPTTKDLMKSKEPSQYLTKLLSCYDGKFNADVISDALSHKDAARAVLKKMDRPCYDTYSVNEKKAVFNLLVENAISCADPEVKVAILRCVRKWSVDASLVVLELNRCLEFEKRQNVPKPSKIGDAKTSQKDSSDWVARSEVVLELVQGKQRIKNKTKLVQPLFKILKKCIALEEQVPVEYLKQLVLTSLTTCCQEQNELTSEEAKDFLSFDVQTVIDCLRCSRNPQTHHHALILLNYAASRYHEQVLHGIMSLFTFMGNSILRQDDAYSTQLIQQTVVNIIPALSKTTKGELHRLSLSAGIFRVFTSAVQDIPMHRRLPVFSSLVETLGPATTMWQLCVILVDNALQRDRKRSNLNADLELATELVWQFGPSVVAQTVRQIYGFLISLPVYTNIPTEDEFSRMKLHQSQMNKSVLDFSRKEAFRDILITVHYVVELVGQICSKFSEAQGEDVEYDALLEKCLLFSKKASSLQEEKLFRLIGHKNLDVIDKINSALDPLKFIEAVALILVRDDCAVKRKVLDMLNHRILQKVEWFEDLENLLELIPLLIEIAQGNAESDEAISLVQTAFFSLKLLAKNLAVQHPDQFVPVFELTTGQIVHTNKLLRASALLCLSELFCLKSLILPNLNNVTSAILKAFKATAKLQNFALDLADEGVSDDVTKSVDGENSFVTAHLLCISTITCLNKMIEHLGSFVGMKFLKKVLIAVLSINQAFGHSEKASHRNKVFQQKLTALLKIIASKIPLRNIMVPMREAFVILQKDTIAASTLMRVLKDTLLQTTKADFTLCVDSLADAFITDFLTIRETNTAAEDFIVVEDAVIDCLISGVVLRITESHFRPLYHKIFDWSRENEARLITFYRFSAAAAERLKSLFVTFAGYVIKEAEQMLHQNIDLAKAILRFLFHIFSNDKEGFVTTERFNILVQPILDLIDSDYVLNGSIAVSDVNDCLMQLAIATNDLNRWQHLIDLIGLKATHENKIVRLAVLSTLEAAATELGKDFLPLLPPAVPFLAELMSDDDSEVEMAAHKLLQKLETVVGEDLQPYFVS